MSQFARRRWWLIIPGLVLLLVIQHVAYRIWANLQAYEYDVAQDYSYRFAPDATVSASLTAEYLAWPSDVGTWNTGLLELNLSAGILSAWYEPYVELRFGTCSARQYVERRAEGLRYLNLSALAPCIPQAGDRIELTGYHVGWKDQEAQIILYDNHGLDLSRLLVVAPHPDDAELGAYGLYRNRQATVVTLTAGDSGNRLYQDLYTDTKAHYEAKAKLRVWNSVTVPLLGGVEPGQARNLGYFDGTLKELYESRGMPVASRFTESFDVSTFRRFAPGVADTTYRENEWTNLVEDLRLLLDEIQPTTIATTSPFLDAVPDHQYTAWALIEALQQAKLDTCTVLFYTIHAAHSPPYFPFGRRGSAMTLPPEFSDFDRFQFAYSHPLDAAVQNEKVLVLDAMNGIRPAPDLTTDIRPRIKIQTKDVFRSILLPRPDRSYFRRFVRSNELFLGMDLEAARQLSPLP